jgi:hypothetical protein
LRNDSAVAGSTVPLVLGPRSMEDTCSLVLVQLIVLQLYEMVTGKPPFTEAMPTDSMMAACNATRLPPAGFIAGNRW